MMALELYDGSLEVADRTWASLVRADPDGTIFHTPAFLRSAHRELGRGTPLFILVSIDGLPTGVCGLEIHEGLLSFMGHPDVTDYRGPAGRPEHVEAVAAELMQALSDRDDWERGDLGGLRADGAWLPALLGAAAGAGLKTEVAEDAVAPFLELERTYQGYLSGLASKLRHEIRRKRRRFLEAFPDAHLERIGPDEVAAAMDRFVELHQSSPGAKGAFMNGPRERFFRGLVDDLLPEGRLALSVLRADGSIVAATIGFPDGPVFRLYNSAFDRTHADVAPGMVLLGMLIEEMIGTGFRAMDMLRDDLAYKYRFGARPRHLARLLLLRP